MADAWLAIALEFAVAICVAVLTCCLSTVIDGSILILTMPLYTLYSHLQVWKNDIGLDVRGCHAVRRAQRGVLDLQHMQAHQPKAPAQRRNVSRDYI